MPIPGSLAARQASKQGGIRAFVEDPKYHDILQRAVEVEEQNANREHWLGWEWHDVRAYPASLMKLVVAGLISVTFKSNSSTTYRLVNRKAVKEALKT